MSNYGIFTFATFTVTLFHLKTGGIQFNIDGKLQLVSLLTSYPLNVN